MPFSKFPPLGDSFIICPSYCPFSWLTYVFDQALEFSLAFKGHGNYILHPIFPIYRKLRYYIWCILFAGLWLWQKALLKDEAEVHVCVDTCGAWKRLAWYIHPAALWSISYNSLLFFFLLLLLFLLLLVLNFLVLILNVVLGVEQDMFKACEACLGLWKIVWTAIIGWYLLGHPF